jgi:hypothetical protein
MASLTEEKEHSLSPSKAYTLLSPKALFGFCPVLVCSFAFSQGILSWGLETSLLMGKLPPALRMLLFSYLAVVFPERWWQQMSGKVSP